jgi:F-type H+-transporting ATPase subunit delta
MAESNSAAQRDANADPRTQQVAAVYAKGLLGAASTAGTVDATVLELDSLVADVLDRFPQWETVLGSAFVSADDKIGMLDRTIGGQASATMLNFLKVLATHGRLDFLRPIQRSVHVLLDEMQGRVPVQVRTATPIDPALSAKIAQALRGMTGREPAMQVSTDPDLIGGLVIRVGDTVYDASVSAQLARMRDQMIHRSVHEIQSRRDRFSHPAAN